MKFKKTHKPLRIVKGYSKTGVKKADFNTPNQDQVDIHTCLSSYFQCLGFYGKTFNGAREALIKMFVSTGVDLQWFEITEKKVLAALRRMSKEFHSSKFNEGVTKEKKEELYSTLVFFMDNVGCNRENDEIARRLMEKELTAVGISKHWFDHTEERVTEVLLKTTAEFYSMFEENDNGHYSSLLITQKEYGLLFQTVLLIASAA